MHTSAWQYVVDACQKHDCDPAGRAHLLSGGLVGQVGRDAPLLRRLLRCVRRLALEQRSVRGRHLHNFRFTSSGIVEYLWLMKQEQRAVPAWQIQLAHVQAQGCVLCDLALALASCRLCGSSEVDINHQFHERSRSLFFPLGCGALLLLCTLCLLTDALPLLRTCTIWLFRIQMLRLGLNSCACLETQDAANLKISEETLITLCLLRGGPTPHIHYSPLPAFPPPAASAAHALPAAPPAWRPPASASQHLLPPWPMHQGCITSRHQ